VEEMRFDRLGVFAYSLQEDTPAARLPGHLPEEVKEYRAAALMELQRSIASEINGSKVGKVLDVLVERYDGRNDVYIGRTQYDAPEIDGEVFVKADNAEIGTIMPVRITHAYEYDLSGVGIA